MPKSSNAKDFTNQRTRKGGVVDEVERAKNKNKSKIRARVEHVFAVVKRLWGFAKVRYRGVEKNATRSFVALGLGQHLSGAHTPDGMSASRNAHKGHRED